jgi:hypothetical protein
LKVRFLSEKFCGTLFSESVLADMLKTKDESRISANSYDAIL